MTKQDYCKRVNSLISETMTECAGIQLTGANMWMGQRIPTPFHYGAISEHYMEKQLQENGKERKTTFMSDLSVGEWYGSRGLFDTIKNATKSWKDDEIFMAEFVFCINWKAWEHDARGNTGWCRLYSVLYEKIRDLVYDYYEGNDEKTAYLYEYLD